MKKLKRKIKKNFKNILSSNFVQTIIAFVISLIVKVIFITCRLKIQGENVYKKFDKEPFIVCLWHGRSMGGALVSFKRNMRGSVITSKHRDGRIMSKILQSFKFKP